MNKVINPKVSSERIDDHTESSRSGKSSRLEKKEVKVDPRAKKS